MDFADHIRKLNKCSNNSLRHPQPDDVTANLFVLFHTRPASRSCSLGIRYFALLSARWALSALYGAATRLTHLPMTALSIVIISNIISNVITLFPRAFLLDHCVPRVGVPWRVGHASWCI